MFGVNSILTGLKPWEFCRYPTAKPSMVVFPVEFPVVFVGTTMGISMVYTAMVYTITCQVCRSFVAS